MVENTTTYSPLKDAIYNHLLGSSKACDNESAEPTPTQLKNNKGHKNRHPLFLRQLTSTSYDVALPCP